LLPRKRAPDTIPNPSADQFTGPHPVSLPNPSLKQLGKSQASIDVRLYRFIGHISLAWDHCIQYLLAGTNPSVLNQHRWGYNLGGADFPQHSLCPFQPTVLRSAWSEVHNAQHKHPVVSSVVLSYCQYMASRQLDIYR
jgi:hypothetical protein